MGNYGNECKQIETRSWSTATVARCYMQPGKGRRNFCPRRHLKNIFLILNNCLSVILEGYTHCYDKNLLPENERIITDVLRQIILESLPEGYKEKISYNVPFFYGKKGICIIWPSAVPRGGIKEGVLLGFWYGNKLKDADNYLTHGNNKQIFYKIFKLPQEINERAIVKLLKEALRVDRQWLSAKTLK